MTSMFQVALKKLKMHRKCARLDLAGGCHVLPPMQKILKRNTNIVFGRFSADYIRNMIICLISVANLRWYHTLQGDNSFKIS